MEVTRDNYYEVIEKIGIDKLSPAMKEGYDFINRVSKTGTDWSKYSAFREAIELHFKAIGMIADRLRDGKEPKKTEPVKSEPERKEVRLKQNKTHPSPKPENEKQSDSHNKAAKSHRKIKKPTVKSKGVEAISPEVSFIKRFALLDGKEKTKDQVLSFIRALQKAILEKHIRKTSKHAKVVMEVQRELIKEYEKAAKKSNENITFDFKGEDLTRYLKIAGAEYLFPSVRFIKSYYNLRQANLTKEKANRLHERISEAIFTEKISPNDKYIKHIRNILYSLEQYLKTGDTKSTLYINESQLSGLAGVLRDCGCNNVHGFEYEEAGDDQENVISGVMSVAEARSRVYRPVHLSGEWEQLIGKMCLPTSFLLYGFGGSKKTSFALLFTQYLSHLGYRILFVAREQFDTPTFKDTLNRLDIVVGDNFQVVKDVDILNLRDFDIIVLDSKDDIGMQIQQFQKLKEEYKEQSFFVISQGTKKGDFTGRGQWRNLVDVMIKAENGVIKTGIDKNRWGGSGEMRV